MANDLNNLLGRVERVDRSLAAELRQQISALAKRREFGLNFEKHKPETVELHGRTVRAGDKVRLVNPRGHGDPRQDDRTWRVQAITKANAATKARLLELDGEEDRTVALDELVVIADFRDPIYPGLRSTGGVQRGGDKPHHVVINAENFHALEAMLFTCQGAVDAIYIDPPYNTGAKDWKYNNDYVDGEDAYRHSKWLSFMERRLKLARKLLKPSDSVLVVTIDEKEYLRLGLLLEQTFPEARIQMISSVINPKGATRSAAFARTDEYVFFVMFGGAKPRPLALGAEWKVVRDRRAESLRWAELLRSGTNARRQDRPKLFYPIFMRDSPDGPVIASIGSPYGGTDRTQVATPAGCVVIWPLRADRTEGNWQVSPEALKDLIQRGYVKLGAWRDGRASVSYLKRGEQRKVEDGLFPVSGTRHDGSIIVDSSGYIPVFVPGTQWRTPSHEAGGPGGSGLLRTLIPGRRFPFPKSLYAVEDCLRFFVADNPDALVVDFFAGSGTTAHAVMRLNRQDQGRRRTISVTNNEVGAGEQRDLIKAGHRPGDREWEALGICDYVTNPRIAAAVTGTTPDGDPMMGDYRFTDPFPMSDGLEENVEFFTLTYEDPRVVGADMAFEAIAPLLWMRAGSQGEQITTPTDTAALSDTYGVLFAIDAAGDFAKAIADRETIQVVFIVTDDEKQFQRVASLLPAQVETVRLYESYLRTFEINTGKE